MLFDKRHESVIKAKITYVNVLEYEGSAGYVDGETQLAVPKLSRMDINATVVHIRLDSEI